MKDKSYFKQVSKIVSGNQFSLNDSDLEAVSHDESSFEGVKPTLLVYPATTEEVSKLVQLAYVENIPITARGAGSSLEGNSIPTKNSMVIDLSRMNKVIEIREDDLQVTVEAGLVYQDLNEALKDYGLFFPPSPGGSSDVATIGGMVSTNASGIYSLKYGGTRDYTLKMKVVTGTGEILEFGNLCVKSSSGYNLAGLICGSEGTLAIVTEITLKLKGISENSEKLAYLFSKEKNAVSAISEMMKYALDIAALEYLDANCISALNKLNGYGLEEKPVIFIELQGTESSIAEVKDYVNSVCEEHNGKQVSLASGQNPWEIRHHTTTAIKLRKKGYTIIRNDIAFPISQLPVVVEKCYQLADEKDLLIHTFGHVGMGILHVLILADHSNKDEWIKGQEMNQQIINFAIDLGGSTSGEHGIGLSLKPYMEKEHGKSLDLMKAIKQVFDPKNILNPDKIFP